MKTFEEHAKEILSLSLNVLSLQATAQYLSRNFVRKEEIDPRNAAAGERCRCLGCSPEHIGT